MDQLTLLDERDQDERGKVESWRLHVLMEAGYPLPLAERLARSGADLHLAVELARQTADRMERRLRDVARAAEAQGEVASERLRHVMERLDAALASAEDRIATFEAEVEVRLDAQLGAIERSARASDRD